MLRAKLELKGIRGYALALLLSIFISGCALFSGNREIPISETAKEELRNSSDLLMIMVPNLRPENDRAMVFVAAFDGTLNDRLHVPHGEDETVVAKLYDAVDVDNELAGPIAKHYEKGPGCEFGLGCWLDTVTGYTSQDTALRALRSLQTFARNKPTGIELRVVVIGFSRGAATARHFLNLVQRENQSGFLHASGIQAWSSALLFDTVATGQESNLNLQLPANVEFAVEYVAQNESRPLFAPVIDNDARFHVAATLQGSNFDQRVWKVGVPGAHSDVGDSYKAGAGALVAAKAKSVLIGMGLAKPEEINLCPAEGPACRNLNEGLHDSRGLIDRLIGAPSPFSCGFVREAGMTVNDNISDADVALIVQRYRTRLENAPVMSFGTVITTRSTDSYVLEATGTSDKWLVVKPKLREFTGYEALVKDGDGGRTLTLTDPVNFGKIIPIPKDVFDELQMQGGHALVEFNLTKPAGPWWFVNGCLPSERRASVRK